MADEYDVIIVGGGVSGLVAGHLLLKERSSLKILIIEATDKVGGPLMTVELNGAKGKDMYDIGVSRVGSAQPLMLALLKEFGLETFEHYDKGTKHWQLPDGKVKKYSGSIPPLAYTALVDLLRYFKKMDKMASQVNVDDLAASGNCAEWDDTSVEQFMQKFLWTQGAKDMAATMVGTFCGMSPEYMPLMLYVYIIHSCGNWENHIGGEGTGRMELKVKDGFEQFARRLEEKIGSERILLGDAVTSIDQSQDKSGATVCTRSGKCLNTKRIIMAIPGYQMRKIEFKPKLTHPRVMLMSDYGVHFVVTYPKSFWKEKKMAGELLSMAATLDSFKDGTEHPIIAFFDHETANGNPALMGLFGSSHYSKMTTEERKSIAINFLVSVLGEEARNCIDYKDMDWSIKNYEEELSHFADDYKTSEVLMTLRQPDGCIHFGSEDAGTVWRGMMESAVESATRAVKEVMVEL